MMHGKKVIADYLGSRDNNFNLLRFVAATAVVASHSVAITQGADAPSWLRSSTGMDVGNLAVDIFFASSGFLVTGSLLKRSLLEYGKARFLRVYPAYVLAIAFSTLCVGVSFTSLPLGDFLIHRQTFWFFLKNLLLLGGSAFSLPVVFVSHPVPNVVNGSLWTLPWEVRLYCFLALLAVACRYYCKLFPVKDPKKILSQSLLSISVLVVLAQIANQANISFPREGTRVACMFLGGSSLFILRQHVRMSFALLACTCGLCLIALAFRPLFQVLYTLLLPYIVLGFALVPGGFLRKFNSIGDYSYGIYIYSFPIQQSIFALLGALSPISMFFTSFACTLCLAVPSWHFIEQRFLSFRSRDRESADRQVSSPAPSTSYVAEAS